MTVILAPLIIGVVVGSINRIKLILIITLVILGFVTPQFAE